MMCFFKLCTPDVYNYHLSTSNANDSVVELNKISTSFTSASTVYYTEF